MTGIITVIPKSSERLCNQRRRVKLRPEGTPQKSARERLGPGSTTHQRKGWGDEGAEGSTFPMAPLALPRKRKEGATISTLAQRLRQLAHVIQGARTHREKGGSISQQGKLMPQELKCSCPHSQASSLEPPAEQSRSEPRKAEPRALGEGRKGTGKGFPSPTPQHLPPFLIPPHWPGCESKTN